MHVFVLHAVKSMKKNSNSKKGNIMKLGLYTFVTLLFILAIGSYVYTLDLGEYRLDIIIGSTIQTVIGKVILIMSKRYTPKSSV